MAGVKNNTINKFITKIFKINDWVNNAGNHSRVIIPNNVEIKTALIKKQ